MEKGNGAIVISRKKLSEDIVYDLLLTLDPSFAKNLSEEVNIKAYSLKLAEHANFEVADISNAVGGVIAFYENDKELYITYVCVNVSKRRMGVADLLLGSICRYADSIGKPVSLEVVVSNVGARNLYEKHGFKITHCGKAKFSMTRPYHPIHV